MNQGNILIFRDKILGSSETFIKAQVEGTPQYDFTFLGSRRINGIDIQQNNIHIINNNKYTGLFNEYIFKKYGYSLKVDRVIKELKPKIIHAHFGPDGSLCIPFAIRHNIPLVITFHGYDVTVKEEIAKSSFLHNIFYQRKDKMIRNGTKFIAVSDYIKDKMLGLGFPEEKIIKHYIGVDTEYFHPENVNREKIVLFVGRLVEKKGVKYLIKAMEIVQKDIPDAKLVIIGDGPLKNELEQIAKEKLAEYEFLGAQTPSNIKKWMNKSMVFCAPSVVAENGDAEGFGMVFAESNAMGLPVVSFASGGVKEAVQHETTGFLANEKNYFDLAKYIKILLQNQQLWHDFSLNGIKRVNTQFNLKTQNERLSNIYDNIITTK